MALQWCEDVRPHPGLPALTTGATRHNTTRVLIAAIALCDLVVVTGPRFLWVQPIAGFCLLLGLPTYLLYAKVQWSSKYPSERLGYSLPLALLIVMVVGLIMNTVLRAAGVSGALDETPVLIAANGICLLLVAWRHDTLVISWRKRVSPRLGWRDWYIGVASLLGVATAAAGAVRINNGAGDQVTIFMLALSGLTFVLLLVWDEQLHPGTVTAAIYLVSLALLLMTSLRGWYTTGHDIQQEFGVFELTKSHGNWSIARERDAYDACLSLTILPTMLWELTRVADAYIFKFFFQVLFAFSPIYVFRVARRYASNRTAILSVIYFVAFPTFFTDMPYLNRQEIAFLFVGPCLLMIGSTTLSTLRRRVWIGAFFVGMALSHYSTTYVFGFVLAVALAGRYGFNFLQRWRGGPGRLGAEINKRLPAYRRPLIGLPMLLLLLGCSLLWNDVLTHTNTGVFKVVQTAETAFVGSSKSSERAQETGYSLVGGASLSPKQLLDAYGTQQLDQRDKNPNVNQLYYPLAVAQQYPVVSLPEANLPNTALGQAIANAGIQPATLNNDFRQGSAKILQIFVLLGLGALMFSRRGMIGADSDWILLAFGAIALVAVTVVVPNVSLDYGVLRAFQQGLLVLAPLVVLGSLTLFRRLGDRRSVAVASGVAVAFFLSLTGLVPQITGGYLPQLNLNNAGLYYDVYYTQPQEIAAIRWLAATTQAGPGHEPVFQTDLLTYQRLKVYTPLQLTGDFYPTLLRTDAYVLVGSPTLQRGVATASISGDIVTYKYPLALLDREKNLIYSSNGARIYH